MGLLRFHTRRFLFASATMALLALNGSAVLRAQNELGPAPVAPAISESTASALSFSTQALTADTITGSWVDTSDRETVRQFYLQQYLASNGIPMQWTGSLSGTPGKQVSGSAGTTSSDFKQAIIDRINWFRAMAGVPADITLNPTFSTKDQQAALMMSANNKLSHSPTSDWLLYTSTGASAAGNSDLALGRTGPKAITAYMFDFGNGNEPVGHRRWLLYPQTQTMGTGDIPATGNFTSSNATWVLDGKYGTTRPATRDTFVAWPPPGFVPYEVVFPRWSFTYPGADFSAASVTMTNGGASVPVKQEVVTNNYGENTLVWVWKNIDADQTITPMDRPARDITYTVQLSNVSIGGRTRSFTYNVTAFDPAIATPMYQPDLSIANFGMSNWAGKSTINTSATDSVSATVATGHVAKFKVRVHNTGNVSDAILLHGTGTTSGFTITYLDGGKNVTAAVTAGTYKVRLPANGKRTIIVKIRPSIATSGAQQNCTLHAQSQHDSSKVDTVSASVTVQ